MMTHTPLLDVKHLRKTFPVSSGFRAQLPGVSIEYPLPDREDCAVFPSRDGSLGDYIGPRRPRSLPVDSGAAVVSDHAGGGTEPGELANLFL